MKRDKTIGVIDFGGQYAHLIAARIRRLGTYSQILSPESADFKGFAGIVLSGGPASVYDEKAPALNTSLFQTDVPILGICYGHQIMMSLLGGKVEKANKQEFGPAHLEIISKSMLNDKMSSGKIVWMSHGDEVKSLPPNFQILASTKDCKMAMVGHENKPWFGIQFHPEVTHTEEGELLLQNFLWICCVDGSWSLQNFLREKLEKTKNLIHKKVFLLVSGGVDSSVAYLFLSKALGKDRVKGLLIDTGFMRKNEVGKLKEVLKGFDLHVFDAKKYFYSKLDGIEDPEQKRQIIGSTFLEVQSVAMQELGLNPSEFILGQGTIYPDTIESGGTKHSQKIKTHHNRVPEIQVLIERGEVIEPLADLYKDEVREWGMLLGLPSSLIERHPFPGPGLAVRMLSSKECQIPMDLEKKLNQLYPEESLAILPIRSVGVQGDQRTYAFCAVFQDKNKTWKEWENLSVSLTNEVREINRVVILVGGNSYEGLKYTKLELNERTADVLREADDLVQQFLVQKNLHHLVWQCPVVLLPIGKQDKPYSIVLRPVESTEAMTAKFFPMERELLVELTDQLLKETSICSVMYDITHKPPGTIEWE